MAMVCLVRARRHNLHLVEGGACVVSAGLRASPARLRNNRVDRRSDVSQKLEDRRVSLSQLCGVSVDPMGVILYYTYIHYIKVVQFSVLCIHQSTVDIHTI
jgi:hypothetical protein